MHICVSKPTTTGSDNGLSPDRCQAIICTNAGILLIGPLGTNFSEILIEIQIFWYKKKYLKALSAKWRPFCLSLNELKSEDYLSGIHGQVTCFDDGFSRLQRRWWVVTLAVFEVFFLRFMVRPWKEKNIFINRLLHSPNLMPVESL